MRTGDTTYIVVRFQERGIACAGTHLIRECAELQATRLNERRTIHDAKWQVQASTYYDDYMDYAHYVAMNRDELVAKAQAYGVAKSGTKADIATRICRRIE